MEAIRVTDNIYWVGAIDWNIRNFHGYTTPRGTTYNAYLMTGEKNILIDTVKRPFLDHLISRIRSVIDPADIDLIVSNHTEMDHSSSLVEMQKLTGAKVLASKKGKEGLALHYPDLEVDAVEDGTEIRCGGKTLTFIEAPMLHWPDSMFTYVPEDKLLFSMDAFGQHYATNARFDDQVDEGILFQEAAKYYANIVMPFGARVVKTLEKASQLDIRILATSHGVIWREKLPKILKAYSDWGSGVTREKAVIVYDTMWGSTATMAEHIADGIASQGVEVEVLKLGNTDRSWVIKEVLDARAVVVGTPTINNTMFPSVADMVFYLKGLRPKGRIGAVFGSYGWGGGGTRAVREQLQATGLELPLEDLQVNYVPHEAEKEKCREMGRRIAELIKAPQK
ncbi:MAG TPA: FprA family A-type flavoprotein [Methanomassiliicoccaceae archaeon]|nr:FprA family A-type flavoprotein [Methanomassiliicoccaceae archaeon]